MNLSCRRSALFLLPCLLLSPSPARAQDAEGEALAQRFLEHLKANAPIAGTFQQTVSFDPALHAKYSKGKDAVINGKHYKTGSEPEKQVYTSSWAWDGSREVMDAPSQGFLARTFFSTPEGLLQKAAEKNYNLTARPGHISMYRPASFYFLRSTSSWQDFLSRPSCKPHQVAAPAGSPPGAVLLVVNPVPDQETRLLLDSQTGRLYGCESTAKGHPVYSLKIDRLTQDKQGRRVFPSKATIIVFDSDVPYRTETLTAKEIVFPKPGEEIDRYFQLRIPGESDVFDRQLNKHFTLSQPALAEAIISQGIETLPIREVRDLVPRQNEHAQRSSYLIISLSLGVAAVVLIGVFLAYRFRARRAR